MNGPLIRSAQAHDAVDIAEIYNHYVRNSTATFDTVEKSVEDRIEWLAAHDEHHPVLVAEADGRVVGWGSITAWAVRPAWRHTVELSIYVAPDSLRRGVGSVLLDGLICVARDAGHHALIAQIVEENAPSLSMAERAGFSRVGTMEEVGRKFDRWLNLVLMQRIVEPEEV
jgi:phosphinothricin acetyltransferase